MPTGWRHAVVSLELAEALWGQRNATQPATKPRVATRPTASRAGAVASRCWRQGAHPLILLATRLVAG